MILFYIFSSFYKKIPAEKSAGTGATVRKAEWSFFWFFGAFFVVAPCLDGYSQEGEHQQPQELNAYGGENGD